MVGFLQNVFRSNICFKLYQGCAFMCVWFDEIDFVIICTHSYTGMHTHTHVFVLDTKGKKLEDKICESNVPCSRVYFHFDSSLFEKWGHFLWVDNNKKLFHVLTTQIKEWYNTIRTQSLIECHLRGNMQYLFCTIQIQKNY